MKLLVTDLRCSSVFLARVLLTMIEIRYHANFQIQLARCHRLDFDMSLDSKPDLTLKSFKVGLKMKSFQEKIHSGDSP